MNKTYKLLGLSNGKKLEQWGDIITLRPSPIVIWQDKKIDKYKFDAEFIRNSSGNGIWKFQRKVPEKWLINFQNLKFIIKLTGFGHTGLFPEQLDQFSWFKNIIKNSNEKLTILNLFAYTGSVTMICAKTGGIVTHLDAAPGVVNWAKENAKHNNMPNNIRWIVDDVQKFVQREIRRGNQYNGIILDPPSFGRGPKGEVWKLEEHLFNLLKNLKKLLKKQNIFFHMSCHTPGFTPLVLKEISQLIFPEYTKYFEYDEMKIPYDSNKFLPAGSFLRFKIF